ncbi:MAG: PTS system mannose/fructose/sorbose family transporter subunit IID [Longimicrobiaceae bacterium]
MSAELPRGVRRRMLARSFLIQGSWNYHTLIGTGFAFTLLPALRHLFSGDKESVRAAAIRHGELFNSHPFLATVAVGAVARLEGEGQDAALIRRFKGALRGSLGSLGDQLFWLTWRPVCALAGIALLLAGAPWWSAVAVFLVSFNALHLWVRSWGMRVGFESGFDVGKRLKAGWIARWLSAGAAAGALLAGFCLVLLLVRTSSGSAWWLIAAAAVPAGLVAGRRFRRLAWTALALFWTAGVTAGLIS